MMRKNNMTDFYMGPLRGMQPIVHQWLMMLEDLEWWGDDKDAPWWYNERASLSILAGAAWRCKDGWAFEEYATKKYQISKKGKKKQKPGRGDIAFGVGNYEYVAEAKQCWPNIGGNPLTVINGIENCLYLARKDSARTPNYGLKRLGMVFASPILHSSKKEQMDIYLDRFIKQLSDLKDICTAWAFPNERRYLKAKNNYFYPGAVVIMKPLKL